MDYHGAGTSYPSRISVPSRGFCFPRERYPEKKLSVSDRVPSRCFCFPRQTYPAQHDLSLIAFLAWSCCFPGKNCQNKHLAGRVFSNGAAAGIQIAKIRFSLAGHFQTAPLRELVLRQLKKMIVVSRIILVF